jgi:A/G-specific adenine glycosylase
VPANYQALSDLPGVGDYTASAVASFAFGARQVVLDTNVRRFFARVEAGRGEVVGSPSKVERDLGAALLPDEDARAALWAVATMELGALVCRARAPRCAECPVRGLCRWRIAGHPDSEARPRRGQAYAGTDRQVRGRLMAVVRESDAPVSPAVLDAVWPDAAQRERCLQSLVADGLLTKTDRDYSLPE